MIDHLLSVVYVKNKWSGFAFFHTCPNRPLARQQFAPPTSPEAERRLPGGNDPHHFGGRVRTVFTKGFVSQHRAFIRVGLTLDCTHSQSTLLPHSTREEVAHLPRNKLATII